MNIPITVNHDMKRFEIDREHIENITMDKDDIKVTISLGNITIDVYIQNGYTLYVYANRIEHGVVKRSATLVIVPLRPSE